MVMWRVTVSPIENRHAWRTYTEQGIIGIGWPERVDDDAPPVRRFKEIGHGDWVVAHVPVDYGGGDCLALGVGRVISDYHEVRRSELPPGDEWDADFRRQFNVDWVFGRVSLRPITAYYRGTVHQLRPNEERSVLQQFGLLNAFSAPGDGEASASTGTLGGRGNFHPANVSGRRAVINGCSGVVVSKEDVGDSTKWVVVRDGERESRSYVSPPAVVDLVSEGTE
jgi:hypothetical protein